MFKSKLSLFSLVFLTLPVSAQIGLTESPAQGHLLDVRWSATATNPFGSLAQGAPTTLTWGFLQDGTAIPATDATESSDPSSLIAFMDAIEPGGTGADLTLRPWFTIFERAYNRWGEVSGLSFAYEAADTGVALDGTSAPFGSLGVVADMRIGGHSIDGSSGSNTLAYNYYPNHGDMVIDTDNFAFYDNNADSYLRFRNVIAHEIGHGLGIAHLQSNNAAFLMEPFINVGFDGPQHSDILAVHRGYGDINEAGGGNDTAGTATALGNAATFAGIGADGGNAVVGGSDVDFVSIDGTSDTDFYSITTTQDGTLDIALDALGLQYQIQRQDNAGSSVDVDTSALNNLALALFGSDGTSLLALADANGLGGSENINGFFLTANTYFIRVTGGNDVAQFYSLDTTFSPAGLPPTSVPEPSHLALLAFSFAGLLIRRRR